MAKIYMIRHCESEGNAVRRTLANVDALVTRKGFQQNEMLRRRFEGVHIDAIYSSDSYRSIMTADPIAKERNLPIHVRITLREITTGVWEDESWGNIADAWPEANYAWSKTPWALQTPGATTFEQLADMMTCGVKKIAREVGPDGVALCVSHSCSIKAALCRWLGKPMDQVLQFGHGDNTSVSLLDVDEEGNIKIEYMNDASHLPDSLKRAWNGVAGAAVNMSVYPVDSEARMAELVKLAAEDAAERGEAFDAEAFRKQAAERLAKDPECYAVSYYDHRPSGFVELGTDKNLPKDTGLVSRLYIMPELQGKHFIEQLFGFATKKLRYQDYRYVVIPTACTKEEQSVIDRFIFAPDYALPEYQIMPLVCPPNPYPIMA